MYALHLSRATAIFVVVCCSLGTKWMFGLKKELTACTDLVPDTTEQSCIFSDRFVSINDMKYFLIVCNTPQPC